MKRLMLAIAATAMIAGPMAVATEAAAQPRGGSYDRDRDRDNRGWQNDRGRGGGWDNDRGRGRGPNWNNGRGNNNRPPAWQWDNRRNNGYYMGDRWYWGPPPVAYNYRYDVRPGFRPWQRGAYLPPAYRGYVVYDYNRYRLRPPPRGYHYVNVNGDIILAAIATGLILEIFSGR